MTNEIVVYKDKSGAEFPVRTDGETVWMTIEQMATLFGRDVKTIGKHIANALKEELNPTVANFAPVQPCAVVAKNATTQLPRNPVVAKFATTAADGKIYQVEYYNLEMVVSVGFRVKSPQGVIFRRWANEVLNQYAMCGVVVRNPEVRELAREMDRRLAKHDHDIIELKEQMGLYVHTAEGPVQGLFFDGQLWDARSLVEKFIAKAKKIILLIDNWVGPSTLDMLAKKRPGVDIEIVTSEHRDRRGNPRPTLAVNR